MLSKEEEELRVKEMEEWKTQMNEVILNHEHILRHFFSKHEWFYRYAKLTDVCNQNFVFT